MDGKLNNVEETNADHEKNLRKNPAGEELKKMQVKMHNIELVDSIV